MRASKHVLISCSVHVREKKGFELEEERNLGWWMCLLSSSSVLSWVAVGLNGSGYGMGVTQERGQREFVGKIPAAVGKVSDNDMDVFLRV